MLKSIFTYIYFENNFLLKFGQNLANLRLCKSLKTNVFNLLCKTLSDIQKDLTKYIITRLKYNTLSAILFVKTVLKFEILSQNMNIIYNILKYFHTYRFRTRSSI